jgi:hypothetical protein
MIAILVYDGRQVMAKALWKKFIIIEFNFFGGENNNTLRLSYNTSILRS